VEGMEFLPRKVEAKQMIFNWSTFSSTPFFLFDLHIFVTDFESSFSVCHTIFFLCVRFCRVSCYHPLLSTRSFSACILLSRSNAYAPVTGYTLRLLLANRSSYISSSLQARPIVVLVFSFTLLHHHGTEPGARGPSTCR
jgi:hypothetical protein